MVLTFVLGLLALVYFMEDPTWTKVGEGRLNEAKYTPAAFRREPYWEIRLDSGDLVRIEEGRARRPGVWTIGSRYVIEESSGGDVRARKVK